ncbi:hypothetical protein D3C71_1446940 [compost metagenome]
MELALHQHRLSAFKGELVGAAVVGEGDGNGANQRKQDKQPHAGDARINVAPGVSPAIGEDVKPGADQYQRQNGKQVFTLCIHQHNQIAGNQAEQADGQPFQYVTLPPLRLFARRRPGVN